MCTKFSGHGIPGLRDFDHFRFFWTLDKIINASMHIIRQNVRPIYQLTRHGIKITGKMPSVAVNSNTVIHVHVSVKVSL